MFNLIEVYFAHFHVNVLRLAGMGTFIFTVCKSQLYVSKLLTFSEAVGWNVDVMYLKCTHQVAKTEVHLHTYTRRPTLPLPPIT